MTRTQVWHPGQGWTRSRYTAAEEAWIARTLAAKADDRRPAYRTVRNRMNNLLSSWLVEVGWVITGLTYATATIPPPQTAGERTRGSTGPSDPTGAVLSSTWAAVDRAAVRLAHLTGPCLLSGQTFHDRCCGETVRPDCNGHTHDCGDTSSASQVIDLFGITLPHGQVVDELMGTPPSARRFAAKVVPNVGSWHGDAVGRVTSMFTHWWDEGAEPHELEEAVHLVGEVERGVKGLAGSLAGWSGRTERTCRAGCGAAVHDPGPEAKRGEGRACGRCQQRESRQRRQETA